jgi:hypothetical protein
LTDIDCFHHHQLATADHDACAAVHDDATCAAMSTTTPKWNPWISACVACLSTADCTGSDVCSTLIPNTCVAAGSSDGEPGSGPPPCVAHCNWDNDNCPQDCDTSSCSTRKNWHMAFSWIHRRLPTTNSLCLSHSPLCFLCCWC